MSNPHEGTAQERHAHSSATASNMTQRPRRKPPSPRPTCRTNGEPNDTTTGRNEAGTDSKQTRRRHRRKARTRDTKQARQGKTTTAQEATSNRATTPDDDDGNDNAPPDMSKEWGKERDENEPARLFNSFSFLIAHRGESRGVPLIAQLAPFSPAHRKP